MTKRELLKRLALVKDDAIIVGADGGEITGVAIDTGRTWLGQPAVLVILSEEDDDDE